MGEANSFFELSLTIPSEQADRLSETWLSWGALSVTLDSEKGLTVLAHILTDDRSWFSEYHLAGEIKIIDPHAWEEVVYQGFQSAVLTSKTRVFSDKHIMLDSRFAFGDGGHPTTQLCADYIEKLIESSSIKSLLDVGCGSGILSILAAKQGLKTVHAFDYDPQSVLQTQKNAKLNHVRISCTLEDATSYRPIRRYDIVVANLLTTIVLQALPNLVSALKPGGYLILSGIGKVSLAEVKKACRDYPLSLVQSKTKKGWGGLLWKVK